MPPETAPDDDESALLSRIDDLRIVSIRPLMPAACLIEELADASVVETIRGARGALSAITRGTDQRLAVVIGPAAAHDPAAVLEFARRLVPVQQRLGGELLLVVRVFLDEPGGGAGNEWPLPRSLVRAPPPDVLGGPVSLGFAPMHLR
mmetsp:Transcript_16773/g.54630  ORF Transcript_16773/g.54630 Transcript_16773/m.54630 type:complete len:148 (+) Transcript_16773:104-547(+)